MRFSAKQEVISGRSRRSAARTSAGILAWLLVILTAGSALTPASAATGGAIDSAEIVKVYDGQIVNSLDSGPDNGIVASNDMVGYRWDLKLTDLKDGVFSQTLPVGWTWDATSLSSLNSTSSAYQSSYVLSDNGRTLTATISIGNGSGNPSLLSTGTLSAIPSGDVANGSVYTATLTATDGDQTVTATADPVTVVNERRADLYKSRTNNNVLSSYDFGDGNGTVPARYADFRLTVQDATGSYKVGARNVTIAQPLTIKDSFNFTSGAIPSGAAAQIVGKSEASGTVNLTQSGTDLTVVLDNFASLPVAWVTVRLWVRNSEVPVDSETALTVENTATPVNWVTTAGDPVGEDPANNKASAVYTTPPAGPANSGITRGKEILLFKNQNASPGLTGDPGSDSSKFTYVTQSQVNIGSLVAARFYFRPTIANATNTANGATNLVAYDFWDPAQQNLASTQIYVGNGAGGTVPATDYTVQYTAGANQANPASNTWVNSASAVPGGMSKVAGIRIVYTAGTWAAGTPANSSYFLAAVSFRLVGEGGSIATDYAQWKSDEATASVNAYVTVQNHLLSLKKAASTTAIVSGSDVTYTLTPKVSAAPGNSAAVVVNGLTVVDTLPAGLVSVDTSGVNTAWQVTKSGDAGSGMTLTFTYVGSASSDATLAPITYKVTTSVLAPVSKAFVNRAVINADGNTQSVAARTATATVSVYQAQIVTEEKAVVGEAQIEVGDSEVSWESRWYNFQVRSQGTSYFVDVLPWNGDSRGTNFHGTAVLKSAELTQANAANSTLEYTTDDRATVYAAAANSTAINWSSTPPADLSTVTALRAVVSDFKAGSDGFGGLKVTMAVDGQHSGDLYVNNTRGWLGGNGVLGLTNKAQIDVVGSSISGLVWNDTNRNGGQDAGETPIVGTTVTLYDSADAQVASTTTGADGQYVFAELHSGNYRTVVDTTTLGASASDVVVNTYDHDGDLDSDSGPLVLGKNAVLPNIDFGYALLHSEISLTKQGQLDGDAVVGSKVNWTFTLTNTGQTDLTNVELVDHLAGVTDLTVTWPGADGKLAVGESAPATAVSTLTQEDIDRGFITNTATVTGTDPAENIVTADADATVTLPEGASLSLTKSGELQGKAKVGATVLWTFTVKNTGNVTLSAVSIADELKGLNAIEWQKWPAAEGILKPGESVTATATYQLTAADIKANKVINTAVANGTTPGGATTPSNKATAEVRYKTVEVEGVGGGKPHTPTATATPTHNPGGGHLAQTGATVAAIVMAALALIAFGGASVLLTRRLRRK